MLHTSQLKVLYVCSPSGSGNEYRATGWVVVKVRARDEMMIQVVVRIMATEGRCRTVMMLTVLW